TKAFSRTNITLSRTSTTYRQRFCRGDWKNSTIHLAFVINGFRLSEAGENDGTGAAEAGNMDEEGLATPQIAAYFNGYERKICSPRKKCR
ncbi:MAG: hypothetical protein UHL07_08820, partial [Bacteroidaceae bacterium]|nr:hypothetical protein [Bacteroidaceae bacterium]